MAHGPSDATASSGGRLGRYHLVEPIGGGPNGEVYRAKVYGVAGFERQFAVKKFFPHVALNTRYAQALSAAARAYGSLEHPRIARLAEFGVSSGHTFTATELSPGIDAARLLAETLATTGLIPPGAALALVSQAARAVGYAHGRGISHLGVAPTNLIVSAEGEVKITDIGILGACLPDRPAHDGRFTTRVHYLAPEQLTGEPASAATDVFALGLVAYEMVTGERAFTGPTAEDVAQAILTGQPREPQLPRPIMRVLQRCLARSPYERFPDARALADALDAAVRVSPVPGTRGEVADLAAAAIRRVAELNEQQMSGALSLNLPTVGRLDTASERPQHGDGDAPTLPFQRETMPPPPPPERTFPELPQQPATTMQGMAPPPIPVPQGVAPPPPPIPPAGMSATLQGMPPVRGAPPPVPRPTPVRADSADETPTPIAGPGSSGRLPPTPRPVTDPGRFGTGEPTADARRLDTGEPVPPPLLAMPPMHARMDTGEPVPPPGAMALPSGAPPPSYETFQGGAAPGLSTTTKVAAGSGGSRKAVIAIVAVLVTAGGALVGWQVLEGRQQEHARGGSGAGTGSAGRVAGGSGSGSATIAVGGSGSDSVAGSDSDSVAGSGSGSGSGSASVAGSGSAVAASAPTDKLLITSTPPGARVFLDGADQGVTPAALPGSTDRHSIALVLPGHAPYIAEIDGKGRFAIELDEVTPTSGPAGIKVKCKAKERYVVVLDGKPTGQLCPTERLEVELGEHTVEIYDLVTETWRKFPAMVRETRLSFRIKVDY